ncbi:MAG: peptide chain release factor N(5)-glutamine methyltransferase [Planktomarina sp.]
MTDAAVNDWIIRAARLLAEGGIDDAGREARILTAHALGIPLSRLTLVQRDAAPDDAGLWQMIDARRLQRVPISHLIGARQFYGRSFKVTPDVLDPRPETETLVHHALSLPFENVLDIGTGSGAILLSLLAERPAAHGVGTDLSQAALDVAAQNAAALGVEARATFIASDLFDHVPQGPFDLIVSNPPYIALDEMAALAPELSHEPRMALTDEGDGLRFYRVIADQAQRFMSKAGHVMVEIGYTQGAAVAQMFDAQGYENTSILTDLDGRDRVVWAMAPK